MCIPNLYYLESSVIDTDCDTIENNDTDVTDATDTTPNIAKVVPLVLTTTLQKDVKGSTISKCSVHYSSMNKF